MPHPRYCPEAVADRSRRAYLLRLKGLSYAKIGEAIGFSHESARRACRRREAQLERESRDQSFAVMCDLATRLIRIADEALATWQREIDQGKTRVRFLEIAKESLSDAARIWPSTTRGTGDRGVDPELHNQALAAEMMKIGITPALRDLQRALDLLMSRVETTPDEAPGSPQDGPQAPDVHS